MCSWGVVGAGSTFARAQTPSATLRAAKATKGICCSCASRGSLVLSGRKIVIIDGDVAGVLLKTGRVALGEQTRGCKGRQSLLPGLVTVVFAVLLIVDSNRIGRGTHIRQVSRACRGCVVAYPPSEFGKGEHPDRFAGRDFWEKREDLFVGGSVCGRMGLPLHRGDFLSKRPRPDLEEGVVFSFLWTFAKTRSGYLTVHTSSLQTSLIFYLALGTLQSSGRKC